MNTREIIIKGNRAAANYLAAGTFLASLGALNGEPVDLSGVEATLASLTSKIDGLELSSQSVTSALTQMQTAFETADQTAILDAIAQLQDAGISVDMTDIHTKLDAIDTTTSTHSENFTQFVVGILGG